MTEIFVGFQRSTVLNSIFKAMAELEVVVGHTGGTLVTKFFEILTVFHSVLHTLSSDEVVPRDASLTSVGSGVILGAITDCVPFAETVAQVEARKTTGTFIFLNSVGHAVLSSVRKTFPVDDIQIEALLARHAVVGVDGVRRTTRCSVFQTVELVGHVVSFHTSGALVLVRVVLHTILDSVEHTVPGAEVQVMGLHTQTASIRRDTVFGTVQTCDWLTGLVACDVQVKGFVT
jgi:hypothetical protein